MTQLVHIVDEVPELDAIESGPVLVIVLDGFLDAGNASALAAAHLAAQSSGRVVASFDVDQLHDYRARRPALTFEENRYTEYEAPRLTVRLMHDDLERPYLLLNGPEPDIRWEAFARGVHEVVSAFGVRLVVSLGSIPMAVPHTRPVQMTNHATRQELLLHANVFRGEIRVPASAQALVEIRMGEWGVDAMGFVAHVPHYLGQFDYPRAAISLLESLGKATDLTWDHAALEVAQEEREAEILDQIADSTEVRDVVAGLEQQYDAFIAGAETSLLAEGEQMPTGEEIGQQFEQFLAGLDDEDGR